MKKKFIIILALITVFGLIGCSSIPAKEATSITQEATNTPRPTEKTTPKEVFNKKSLNDTLERGIRTISEYYEGTYNEDSHDIIRDHVKNVWFAKTNFEKDDTRMFLTIYEETREDKTSYLLKLIFNYQDNSVRSIPILLFADTKIKTDNNTYEIGTLHDSGRIGTNFYNLAGPPRVFSRMTLGEENREMMEDIITSKNVTVTAKNIEWTCSKTEIEEIKIVYDAYIKALNGGEIM